MMTSFHLTSLKTLETLPEKIEIPYEFIKKEIKEKVIENLTIRVKEITLHSHDEY